MVNLAQLGRGVRKWVVSRPVGKVASTADADVIRNLNQMASLHTQLRTQTLQNPESAVYLATTPGYLHKSARWLTGRQSARLKNFTPEGWQALNRTVKNGQIHGADARAVLNNPQYNNQLYNFSLTPLGTKDWLTGLGVVGVPALGTAALAGKVLWDKMTALPPKPIFPNDDPNFTPSPYQGPSWLEKQGQ